MGQEKKIEVELRDHVKICLEMPVKFRVIDYHVEKEIITSEKDPKWCVNIKRGIINHLYLPIDKDGGDYQIRPNEVIINKCVFLHNCFPFWSFCSCVSLYDHGKQYKFLVFMRLLQVSVLGKCSTTYSITNKKPYYRVKRVIDMDKCVVRKEFGQTNVPNIEEFVVKRQVRIALPAGGEINDKFMQG